MFTVLIAFGSQALGKAFNPVSKVEWWARTTTVGVILLVGIWLTVQTLMRGT